MLTPLAEGLWSLETHVRAPGGVRLPARMTVVRLDGGDLLLHSPIRLAPEDIDALRSLGPVAHVFAPNKYHHLFVADAVAAFPHAQLLGAPGLADKRKDLRFAGTVTDDVPESWRGQIDACLINGAPELNEVVLFHRSSRTLITTDLLFNIERPANFATKLALTTMGTRGRFAQSRWWWWYTRERAAAARSADAILRWEFERVIMAHGDPVTESARRRTEAALAWMLAPLRRGTR